MLYSDSLRKNQVVDEVKIEGSSNFYLKVSPLQKRYSDIELVMKRSDLMRLKWKIEEALQRPPFVSEENVERYIFEFEHAVDERLRFAYNDIEYLNKKPVLEKMVEEKLIRQVSKDNEFVVFEYVAA